MAFEIVKTFAVRAPVASVWEFLTDVERVAKCLPGAAITGKLDERTWSGTMSVKLGPVSSSYKGKVVFEKLDAAARTAEIAATGADVKGKGGADLRLTSTLKELAPGETEVSTVSRVNISGILAQMGRGMVEDVGERMFQMFSQNMRAELERPLPPPQEVAALAPAPVEKPAAQPQPQALDVGSLGASVLVRRPAAQAAPTAALAPAPVEKPAAQPQALDVGSLGASVLVRRPEFWLAVAAAAAIAYWLLR